MPLLTFSQQGEVAALLCRYPPELKKRFAAKRKGSVNQGYFGIAETSAMNADAVEGWVFTRRAFAPGLLDWRGFEGAAASEPAAAAAAAANLTAYWPAPEVDQPFFGKLVRSLLPLVAPLTRAILEGAGATDPGSTRRNCRFLGQPGLAQRGLL